MVVSSSAPAATTSIAQGKTTVKGTAAAATNPVGGGSGTQTTEPGIGPTFPTQVVVPSKTLPVAGSGTKTKTGAGHKGTS